MASAPTTLPEIQSTTRQEVGVMLGFMAVFALLITTFTITWRINNRRQAALEQQQRTELREKGFGLDGYGAGGGAGVGEKEKEKTRGIASPGGGVRRNEETLLERGVEVEEREEGGKI